MNQFGLRPAVFKGSTQIMPLTVNKDLDELGLLNGVTTFNFHPHLPHYALTTDDSPCVRVLTRQSIDLDRPHPFTAAGNTEFNSFVWMPPKNERAGHILLADSTIFTTLFGGGTGEMRLTDAENANESGIDIVASPPGKKLQNVLLLSGGEKAMAALALLMAIFRYQPSPFCVLDEVDAPLDDANIARLTRLLREMAMETQFIVITHSKKTMESAQSMYGVTMQEAGVSKLVSVKFHGEREHQRIAETAVA